MTDISSRYFPTPLAGEFIYGTYVRWCSLNPTASKLKVGARTVNILLDFQGQWLRALSERIGVDVASNQRVLSECSLVPLHNSFYSSQKLWTSSMVGKYSVKTEKSYHFLKFCPSCAEEDQSSVGLAYWRAVHQSPLLLRCPVHKTQLIYLEGERFSFSKPASLDINDAVTGDYAAEKNRSQQELTSFQYWIENLQTTRIIYQKRNLAVSTIDAVREAIGFKSLPTITAEKRLKALPARDVLIKSIKESGYESSLFRGERSKDELRASGNFSIYKLLDHEKRYSPLFYLLLAWTFLTPRTRDRIFGVSHA